MLKDILLGGLGVREEPMLLFIIVAVVTISAVVEGMGGAD